jgi:hypothetical protein
MFIAGEDERIRRRRANALHQIREEGARRSARKARTAMIFTPAYGYTNRIALHAPVFVIMMAASLWEFVMAAKPRLATALIAAMALAAAPAGAQNILQLGGAKGERVAASPGVARKSEHGVTVYRGAKPVATELAGAGPAPAATMISKTIIVEHHYHSRIRHLRTQGFYSGHPGKSRRFTQGFYSGPVDKGRRAHSLCAHS